MALAVLTAMLAPYASSGRLLVPAGTRADRGPRCRATGFAPWWSATVGPGRERVADRPVFPRRDRARRPAAAGRRRVRHRRRGPGPDRRAARRRPGPVPATSRRSPAVSRWITSTARTTPSSGPPSTTSGATYVPDLDHPWPGKLLDLTHCDPITLGPVNRGFDPRGEGSGLWVYRRIADPRNFRPGHLSRQLRHHPGELAPERLLARPVCRPGRDHGRRPQATSPGPSSSACRCSTGSRPNAPRPDGKTGWKGLRLRPDLVGTEDGLAKAPYIRESRRIKAEFTVVEQHVGTEARRRQTHQQNVEAETFPGQRRRRQLPDRPASQHGR